MPARRVVLVIPARDEAAFLPRVLAAVPDDVWRMVVVDDASRDHTRRLLAAWRDDRLIALHAPRPRGVGGAILWGYRVALEIGARAAAVVAGDAQMDLGELPRVLAPVLAGQADYVQGVRFEGAVARGPMPLTRLAGNRILSACATWAAGAAIGDSQCGYTAAGAGFLRHLVGARLPEGYGFPAYVRIEAHRAGFRVAEVPVRALYGSEVSGIRPWRDPALIAARILWRGLARRATVAGPAVAVAPADPAGGSA